MELNYKVSEQDYLQVYMYAATRNPIIKKQRKNGLIRMIVFSIIGLCLMYSTSLISLLVYFLFVVFIFCFYFFYYERKYYETFYLKNIRTNLKNKIGLNSKVVFGLHDIILTEPNTESKFNYSNIELIEEIKDYYYLKMITGERFILPKNAIQNPKEFNEVISRLTKDNHIPLQQELNWKWR
ncbi:YcxB family protein [Elizabethkingia anophelis]|uniref:YcxB family protein n=1 Tax=Elizabethkingia anophelis TaxID=1117645 RepID=UPI000B35AEC7|nr:YcxB family protein [Elizabethkingia anophelis]